MEIQDQQRSGEAYKVPGGFAGQCGTASAIDVVEEVFTYHAPTHDQIEKMRLLRDQAKMMARTIAALFPYGNDRRAALRKLRECVMTANASLVLNGLDLT